MKLQLLLLSHLLSDVHPTLGMVFNKRTEKNWNNIRRWFIGKTHMQWVHKLVCWASCCPHLSGCRPGLGKRGGQQGRTEQKDWKKNIVPLSPHFWLSSSLFFWFFFMKLIRNSWTMSLLMAGHRSLQQTSVGSIVRYYMVLITSTLGSMMYRGDRLLGLTWFGKLHELL